MTIDEPARLNGTAVGGLLTVANVLGDDTQALWFGVQYETSLTGHSRRYVDGTDKVFDKLAKSESGDPVTIYRGLETSLLTSPSTEEQVRKAFDEAAGFGVEEYVQELLNAQAVDITPTPGTPVTNIKAAVGMLEQYAAEHYAGVPTLHANKYATALMNELVIGPANSLHTPNGTPIASGGGYGADGPGALTADPGEAWVYISGQVNIWRGEVQVVEGPALKENRNYTLAEATYLATVDTFVAAILIGI
jgi:hypothetical protein